MVRYSLIFLFFFNFAFGQSSKQFQHYLVADTIDVTVLRYRPLSAPVRLYPRNDSILTTTLNPKMVWRSVSGATAYNLLVKDNSSNLTHDSIVVTDTFRTVSSSMSDNKRYKWFVRTKNSSGIFGDFNTTAFICSTNIPTLAQPTLTTPSNNAMITNASTINFGWSQITNNAGYKFWVQRYADGIWNNYVSGTVTGTNTNSYSMGVANMSQYRWYVYTRNVANEYSVSSDTFVFYDSVLTITSFSSSPHNGNSYLEFQMIDTLHFSWGINKSIVSQRMFNGETWKTITIGKRDTVFTVVLNTDFTYTLEVTDVGNTVSSALSYTFYKNGYWGLSADSSASDATIAAMSNDILTTFVQSRTFTDLGNRYIYFAWKIELGGGGTPYSGSEVKFVDGGFEVNYVAQHRSFTNASGGTSTYYIWRSLNKYSNSSKTIGVTLP